MEKRMIHSLFQDRLGQDKGHSRDEQPWASPIPRNRNANEPERTLVVSSDDEGTPDLEWYHKVYTIAYGPEVPRDSVYDLWRVSTERMDQTFEKAASYSTRTYDQDECLFQTLVEADRDLKKSQSALNFLTIYD
jgi:hypothetical protein